MKEEIKKNYTVKEKVKETNDVVTLKLVCKESNPSYYAGQFITIFFPEEGTAEGKAYSISSEPFEETINITVKGIGTFSNKLIGMKVGDNIVASLPYGYFYSESETSSLVMVAGGIGVAPFRGMILDLLRKNPKRRVTLFCSNKTSDDIISDKEFKNLQSTHENFLVKNYITRQENVLSEMKKGRIKIDEVLEETKDIKDVEFFICGSISFVRDFWRGLKAGGVPEEKIYTEAFF